MVYQLLANEALPQGITRIACEQLDRATKELTDEALREALVERRRGITEDGAALEARIHGVLATIYEARRRITSWPLTTNRFSAIGPGLKKTYRRGRKAFGKAYKDPTPERFHEWRKRVKYHWYHSRLLRNVWPSVMKGYRSSLKTLSSC